MITKRRYSFIMLAFLLTYTILHASTQSIDAANLLEKIRISEQEIRNVQAHMVISFQNAKSDSKYIDMIWGYESGKEFIEGKRWLKDDKNKIAPSFEHFAFDGEKEYHFRELLDVDSNHPMKITGGLFGFQPDTFSVDLTPHTLMGYSIVQKAQQSLSESLKQAVDLSVGEKTENIDNNMCYVMEARGISEEGNPLNYRIWIDPSKGFRPLKIECYRQEKGLDSWALLIYRIANIKLENVDGIWFPVQGEQESFRTEMLPSEGLSKEEFTAKYSSLSPEEGMKKLKIDTILNPNKIVAKIDAIQINKEIDPAKFKVVFPQGCVVWDDFLQTGYKVGVSKIEGLDENRSADEFLNNKKNQSLMAMHENNSNSPNDVNKLDKINLISVMHDKESDRRAIPKKYFWIVIPALFLIIGICVYIKKKL